MVKGRPNNNMRLLITFGFWLNLKNQNYIYHIVLLPFGRRDPTPRLRPPIVSTLNKISLYEIQHTDHTVLGGGHIKHSCHTNKGSTFFKLI